MKPSTFPAYQRIQSIQRLRSHLKSMNRSKTFGKPTAILLGLALVTIQWGCAGPAASKTVKGAGTGAAVGAVGGAIAGEGIEGIAAAGAAGAIVGATIGAIQEGKERKRQDTLAQQRAYNQAIAMQKRAIDKEKAALQEELDIAEGFRISSEELEEMEGRATTAEERLKVLQAKRQAAIDRKNALDEAEQREKDALAEIERLEKELAELEGESETSDGTAP